MSNSKNAILLYIRVVAMLFIVSCHLLDAFKIPFAHILNIGVQIFLVLSGYLYGSKVITDFKDLFYKRIKKLYIPLFIFLSVVFPYYYFFTDYIGYKAYGLNYLNLQGFPFVFGGNMIPGIRHLWFMTAIMFSYLCLPFLQILRRFSVPCLVIATAFMIFGYVMVNPKIMFVLSWGYLFAIGFFLSNISRKVFKLMVVAYSCVAILLLYGISIDNIVTYFDLKNRILHDIGAVLCLAIPVLFCSSKAHNVPDKILFLDKLSFYIYIVHYFFIFGPCSLISLTSYTFINIVIIISVSFVAASLLYYISEYIRRTFNLLTL